MELLILDEPTSGLDPLMESAFEAEILAEKARGRTILLSSHILSEVEALADRVSIIRDGVVVETGSLAQMRKHTRTVITAVLAGGGAGLESWPGVRDLRVDGDRVRFSVDGEHLGPVMAQLSGRDITALTVEPPSLQELFLRHYGTELAG